MFEDFLPLVAKPARYINSEVNCVRKDLSKVKTKICLLFPDTYEVGMSHLGLRILYHILNGREDTACERAFLPWTDYEALLRASGRPLASLESNLPLSQFDIIGVTLQYELSYTNVLAALDLAGIPLRSSERTDLHPLIIAGGPCAVNPEPLSDFIDAFFIGEAEEAVHEIVELRQQYKGRQRFLDALSGHQGFYVPASRKKPVRRRIVRDLESAPWPDRPLVPLMKPVHDRATVEIARGCIRGCRFCQAGIIYRPYRERSPQTVAGLLDKSLRCTGYDELSLASLSSGDYSAIEALMRELANKYKASRVSISLPSLRIGTLTPEMIRAVADVRKTGFTLAPEAGTERLRRVINKPVTEEDLRQAAELIFSSGWSLLKLYFMIGLPTETNGDLDGIIRLALDLLALGKRVSKRHVQLNISVSTFVPKPHTPFQWFGQALKEDVLAKQEYLEKGLKRRGIALKPHGADMSLLEAAFSRGDAALGRVIERAVQLGCRFDGWTECFDFARWAQAFRESGLEPEQYASRSYGPDEPLPWDYVDTGVTKSFLRREHERALRAEITENCRTRCEGCGVGCRNGGTASFGKSGSQAETATIGTGSAAAGIERPRKLQGAGDMTTRMRMKFTKTGRLRFLSHLDLMTLFQRTAARAGIPVAFSQGFNPHPRISFGPALSVGMESESEYLDMETDPFVDLFAVTKGLNAALPQEIRVVESGVVSKKAPSLTASISRYAYAVGVPAHYAGGVEDRVKDLLAQPAVMVVKEDRQKDIRPAIEAIEIATGCGSTLLITLQDTSQVKPRVQDVVERLFDIDGEQSALFLIRRTAMYCKYNGRWASPMDVRT